MNTHLLPGALRLLILIACFAGCTAAHRVPTNVSSQDHVPTQLDTRWHSPQNWDRLKLGMSFAQVTEILGPPTSTGAGGMGPLWYYEGPVPSSGQITGVVQFYQKRLWKIDKPVY